MLAVMATVLVNRFRVLAGTRRQMEVERLRNAIRAGASRYLLKKHISQRLYAAIEEVMAGGAPMSPG